MRALRMANLALAFALELAVLAALVAWGFAVTSSLPGRLGAGVGAAVAWAVIWGLVGSPQGRVQLTGLVRLGFEVVWFGVGAIALVQADHRAAGIVLIAAWAVNATLLRLWGQTTEQLARAAG